MKQEWRNETNKKIKKRETKEQEIMDRNEKEKKTPEKYRNMIKRKI